MNRTTMGSFTSGTVWKAYLLEDGIGQQARVITAKQTARDFMETIVGDHPRRVKK